VGGAGVAGWRGGGMAGWRGGRGVANAPMLLQDGPFILPPSPPPRPPLPPRSLSPGFCAAYDPLKFDRLRLNPVTTDVNDRLEKLLMMYVRLMFANVPEEDRRKPALGAAATTDGRVPWGPLKCDEGGCVSVCVCGGGGCLCPGVCDPATASVRHGGSQSRTRLCLVCGVAARTHEQVLTVMLCGNGGTRDPACSLPDHGPASCSGHLQAARAGWTCPTARCTWTTTDCWAACV
jgi:hypothetical protein